MTIADLGSIGELIAAIATLATLGYLAVQVRQNTKALHASTFQQVSEAMAQNVSHLTDSAELAEIMVKVGAGEAITPVQQVRFQGLLLMSMRRLESVYQQQRLGSMEKDQVQGVELSMISLLGMPAARTWWSNAKPTFHPGFVDYVDGRIERNELLSRHPSLHPEGDAPAAEAR